MRPHRRAVVALLGSAAVWPLSAWAQQSPMPVVGFLNGASPQGYALYADAFRLGLKQSGYTEGENVAIEYRWAEGHYEWLPDFAADLVHRNVAVIVANTQAAPVAKAATQSIPIVFLASFDPVEAGLVESLNRPGSNVTGVSIISSALGGRHVGLLRELSPALTSIALLANPGSPGTAPYIKDAEAAAQTLGKQIHVLNAGTVAEIDAAFATLPQIGAGALIVVPDAFFLAQREQLAALAMRGGIPTLFARRAWVEAGGLMSYGPSLADEYRQAGVYAGKILKGAKPTDLPVLQPTTFELVINLNTAKALALEIPPSLLAIADEVIE
jgi:ABC-type uncharacterized transport system substrate-binding protein